MVFRRFCWNVFNKHVLEETRQEDWAPAWLWWIRVLCHPSACTCCLCSLMTDSDGIIEWPWSFAVGALTGLGTDHGPWCHCVGWCWHSGDTRWPLALDWLLQTCLTLTLAQPRTGLISIKIRFTITWVTPDNKTSHKCPQCHAQSDFSSLNNGFDFSVAIMISISASWSTLTPGDINAKLYMELLALRIRDSVGKTIVIKFVTSRAWLWSKWRNRCWWPVRSRDNFDNSGV